ncbi:TetR family transcriptional regulator [Cryptosporangium phraense]|uniref:TetR family transcriptional regulator n=1 Tax=Cryptosporangium phraense TaxID=2593070 RepID=A0A545AVQ2_9ACTN|nr:TetR family transcriptional regulator [Cryptosporangium phraense]TQS45384.1 TetR family transcriptional regulator [Cryptosporangium phraense]
MPDDTRSRILRVALEEFAARGYNATSLREIAERLGVSKAAVLYHFPSKKQIVTALAEPMLADMDAAVAAASSAPGDQRWAVMERLLEVWLEHRHLLRMGLRDMALASDGPVFERFRDAMALATHVVAGPVPDLSARVRAIQMLGMLSDPVVIFADLPTELLRAQVLAGVRVVFDATAGPPPARTPPPAREPAPARTPVRAGRGRPRALSADLVETAVRMRDSGEYTVAEIAAQLGVSRATLFRHLPPN